MVHISRSRVLAAFCALAGVAAQAWPLPQRSTRPISARSDRMSQSLPTVGGQRVIAFFMPERGSCAVNTIMWKDAAADAALYDVLRQAEPAPGRGGSLRRRAPVDEPVVRGWRLDPCGRRSAGAHSDRRSRERLALTLLAEFSARQTNLQRPPLREGVVRNVQ